MKGSAFRNILIAHRFQMKGQLIKTLETKCVQSAPLERAYRPPSYPKLFGDLGTLHALESQHNHVALTGA